MTEVDALRAAYKGDAAWNRFLSTFWNTWVTLGDKELYTSKIPDVELAAVLATAMGVRGIGWFEKAIPALDGQSASEILVGEPDGTRILRSLLMVMHF
jgi:hypothetical protein